MTIHKEGYKILFSLLLVFLILNGLVFYFLSHLFLLQWLLYVASFLGYMFFVQFFRNPKRVIQINENHVLAPADGKVVVIEEVYEEEYFQQRRMQISIFMSPLNVHVNRSPVDGIVKYFKYHSGKYLVAWHPKSSTENERTTLVVQNKQGVEILLRQIAGAVARRIICYKKEGQTVNQGEEFGFIKFGSRVDIFLPLNAKIKVKLGEKPVAGKTILAEIV